MNELSKPFVGHGDVWQNLMQEAGENRLPGAYLFYGPPGIGKSLVVQNFVAKLFCNNTKSDYPCGECTSCLKVASVKHPDFLVVNPKENRKTISVDQCREVIEQMQMAPLEAPLKVICFPNTAQLAASGWNALLKSIEEPRPYRLFILVSTSLSRVLPTIRSRCRKLAFMAPNEEASYQFLVKKNLDQFKPAKIKDAVHLSSGSLGLAQQILQQGIIEHVAQFWSLKTFSDVVAYSDKILKSETSTALFLQASLRHMLDKYLDSKSDIILNKIEKIKQAAIDIERNVNKNFVLESLHSF